MANHGNPYKTLIVYLDEIKHHTHLLAARDNEYDPQERTLLRLIDIAAAHTEEAHDRDRLGELIKRGGDPSAYMNGFAAPLGMKVVPINQYTEPEEKIVPFRTRDANTAG